MAGRSGGYHTVAIAAGEHKCTETWSSSQSMEFLDQEKYFLEN